MIGDELEIYSFEYLMSRALSLVPDDIDKREGSIIYDALAPACYELAAAYMEIRNVYKDTFVTSSQGESLDLRVAEQGLSRYAATYAIKRADFSDASGNPIDVPIGSRYSTISDTNPINYVVTGEYIINTTRIPGAYMLRCEESGVIGNEYTGPMTNITFVQGLAAVNMTSLLSPARDEESDDELRERYFENLKSKPFGGNIAQYRNEISEIDGVGQVQIYPFWNGGGSVKCSIVDPQGNPISPEFISTIKNIIDPAISDDSEGQGLGLAPIGHVVTISTPDIVTINVSCYITVETGYAISLLKSSITSAIRQYIDDVKDKWSTSDELNNYACPVYISKIIASILSVSGVSNVVSCQINGSDSDLILLENGQIQQIPSLGEVLINE